MEQDRSTQTRLPVLRRLWSIVQWTLFGTGCLVILLLALLVIAVYVDMRGRKDIEWAHDYELLAPRSELDVLDSLYQPLHPYLNEYVVQFVIRFHSAEACERFEQEILKRNPHAEADAETGSGFRTPLFERFRSEHGEGARFCFSLYAGCPYACHLHPGVTMLVCRGEGGVYYVCAEKY